MSIEMIAVTDIGREREYNEDSVYEGTIDGAGLLAVADGMGGHRAGDVASEEALETFLNALEETSEESCEDVLVAAAKEANSHLRALAEEDPELDGMGTTLVAAVVKQNTATLVNVGDSRGYHVTDQHIEQVTTDQSLVQELVEQGTIEPEEADDHPQKNVLSQALGTNESIEPDTYQVTLEGTLLLCSDGLSDEVSERQIRETVVSADTLEAAATDLVDRANEVDGGDNISVVLGR